MVPWLEAPAMPKVIGLFVLENTILKGFVIYERSGHLGHVTIAICITFRPPP